VTRPAVTNNVTGTVTDQAANPVPGVTLTATATGQTTVTTTTDGSGNYTLAGLLDASTWDITPTKTGYTFSPTNTSEAISGANVTSVNFTATASGGGGVLLPIAVLARRHQSSTF
jgi:phosphatidate phosphatase APP1